MSAGRESLVRTFWGLKANRINRILLKLMLIIYGCGNKDNTTNNFKIENKFYVDFEEVDEKLLFKTKVWGIAGNHFQIELRSLMEKDTSKVTFFLRIFFIKKSHQTH